MSGDAYTAEIVRLVYEAGADRVGVTSAEPLVRARAALEARTAQGHVDTMQFTFRNPERSTTPTLSVQDARSIIVAARSYYAREVDGAGDAHGSGKTSDAVPARIARYAWRDHYEPLRDALRVAAQRLKRDGHRATVFADDNSIVDREVAYRAGLGWYGKNANLLLEGLGSWFVLGCLVTTAELTTTEREVADGCGSCRRCIDACPTAAIVEPGVVDARRCLAWLLQKPGTFDPQYRATLGTRIYGCDDCQEACPPTMRRALDRTVGDERTTVDAIELLTASDARVLELVGEWYVADRNPRWVRRNALLVLGNSGALLEAPGDSGGGVSRDEITTLLATYFDGDDELL
ncbi:MAG: tRNA epoxyqueuosine(34) reductase QueG, partial [Actinobacteria bacterium]|nr:tRNA epoxyqueuosine(34) reductase QueG [Actinomycetota bacterium]